MKNSVVVITGGSSGIGKAAAAVFAEKGHKVYELSRRDVKHANSLITHISCDVTDESQVRDVIAKIVGESRKIDILVSNAGFGISGPIEFTQTSDAKRQFDVNVFGTLNIIKAVLPCMRSQHSGKIIVTSSVAAVLSIPYQSFYSASKAALNALVLALRNEVADFGISATALMPGDVSTGFTDARDKEEAGADIYNHSASAIAAMEKDERSGMTAEYLGKQLYKIACKQNLAPLYTAGWQYKIFVLLEKILPKRLSNWIVGQLYK